MSDVRLTAAPVWFGPAERPLFGWLHTPADGRASGAVVLCPPLTRERASVHASFRALAEQLADAGLVAVRFDYDGTGDSAGTHEDPDRLGSWLASVEHAVAVARSTGAERVGLVGMRMGALLAASSSDRLHGVEALVLWDPCWSGRTFVREQRAISLLRFGIDGPGGDAGELPGFRFDQPTIEVLSGLRLSITGVHAAGQTLVLSRPGFRAPPRAQDDLATAPVEWEITAEESGLLDAEPVRQHSVTRVVEWLGQALAGPRYRVCTKAAESTDAAVVAVGHHLVVERCRTLGPVGLIGIETSPLVDAGGPIVVMPNTAADWHAGTNRLWVHLARHLATRGLRSIRFDVSGLGDSPARPGQRAQLVYAPDALDDIADVSAEVSPEDPGNVVLVGLCSGGYLSLEGALRLSARGVCAINPALRFTPPEMATGPMDRRRRICQPTRAVVRAYGKIPEPIRRRVRALAWRVAVLLARSSSSSRQREKQAAADVGSVDNGAHDELASVIEAARRTQSARSVIRASLPLASLRTRLRPMARRVAGLLARRNSPSRWLEELAAAGVDVFCIGGEDELGPLIDGERRARSSLTATGRCRLEVWPGLDHSLLFSPQRDELTATLLEYLGDRYAMTEPAAQAHYSPANPSLGAVRDRVTVPALSSLGGLR